MGMTLRNHIVESLLIEEASTIKEEYYVSFTLDRSEKKFDDVKQRWHGYRRVAANNPDDLIKLHISPSKGLDNEMVSNAVKEARLNSDYSQELIDMISNLYRLFVEGDCDWSR